MKSPLLILIVLTFSTFIFGKTNDVTDFIGFSKNTVNLKQAVLGLKRWTDERPVTQDESMFQINLFTDS